VRPSIDEVQMALVQAGKVRVSSISIGRDTSKE
jgi:hypothetical protein